jgi:hypothetical protein
MVILTEAEFTAGLARLSWLMDHVSDRATMIEPDPLLEELDQLATALDAYETLHLGSWSSDED